MRNAIRVLCRHISTAEKQANFGSVIDQLQARIPDLLDKPLPNSLIHPNVTLRLFPETHAIEAHGMGAYRVSTRILQTGIMLFILPPHTKISILSATVTKAPEVEDRLFQVHWRTRHEQRDRADRYAPFSPGKILESLSLAPHEYPILAGSFEFQMSSECDKILVHVVRDVEYLAKPSISFE